MTDSHCEHMRELLSALLDEEPTFVCAGERRGEGGMAGALDPLSVSPLKGGEVNLSGDERRAADGHLAECAACRRWFEGTKAACQRLKLHPVIEAHPGFDAAVMARVTAGPLTRVADALDNWICTPARQIAAATAGALVLSGLLLWGAAWVVIATSPPRADAAARHLSLEGRGGVRVHPDDLPPILRGDAISGPDLLGRPLAVTPPRPLDLWPEFLRRRVQPQRPEEQ
ncbi:MAG TPA: hypothetical protein VM221_07975 [Armatimonadota bacterium]|nr:hypothetical protein [Armatimonadota bacterium]